MLTTITQACHASSARRKFHQKFQINIDIPYWIAAQFEERNLLIFLKNLAVPSCFAPNSKQNYFSTHKCVPTTHHFLVDPFLTIWEEFIIIIHTHIPSEDFWPAVIHLLAKKMLRGPTTTYTGCCFKFHRSFGALMFTLIS